MFNHATVCKVVRVEVLLVEDQLHDGVGGGVIFTDRVLAPLVTRGAASSKSAREGRILPRTHCLKIISYECKAASLH